MASNRSIKPLLIAAAVVALTLPAAAQDRAAAQPESSDSPDSEVWTFLRDKYDADEDGSVSKQEYGRADKTFGRLDSNSDGSIDVADFADNGGGMQRMISRFMAQSLASSAFGSDDDKDSLARAELAGSFDRMDGNLDGKRDGRLTTAEWDAAEITLEVSPMFSMRLGKQHPLSLIVAQAEEHNEAAEGDLTRDGLLAWFDASDSDGDGVWSTGRPTGRPTGRRPSRRSDDGASPRTSGERSRDAAEPAAESMSGPIPGSMAPDFTLKLLHGDEPVTLSSFVGKRPVALIFGSYT